MNHKRSQFTEGPVLQVVRNREVKESTPKQRAVQDPRLQLLLGQSIGELVARQCDVLGQEVLQRGVHGLACSPLALPHDGVRPADLPQPADRLADSIQTVRELFHQPLGELVGFLLALQ